MNKKFLATSLLILMAVALQAKNLKALFSHKTFYSPEKGPYVETYLSVFGNSVEFKQLPGGKFQGAIEVSAKFSQADAIKSYDKYNLISPEVDNLTDVKFNFLDQQRILLPKGKYTLELTVKDKNTDAIPFSLKQEVNIDFDLTRTSVSEIELIESFAKATEGSSTLTKSGYDLIPQVDNFYTDDKSALNFYAEVYNTNLSNSDMVLIKYYIENSESKNIISQYSSFIKKQPTSVIPVLAKFNITDLPSGNYNIVVDVKSKDNILLATNSTFFYRHSMAKKSDEQVIINDINTSNTFADAFTDPTILAAHISSLQPIANANESTFIENQLKLSDLSYMKKFFYHFWQQRDAINPEQAWLKYKEEVEIVQANYGTRAVKGYNTDRGRIYLKYGKPNTLTESHNEPSAYPYEVWHYYKIQNHSNKKFVFYNKDLIGKNFSLLHSDYPGEVYDQQWEAKLHARNFNPANFDDKGSPDYFGKKAGENFETPR